MSEVNYEDWRVQSGWSCSSGLTYWLSNSTELKTSSYSSFWSDSTDEELFEAAVENVRRQTTPPGVHRLHLRFTADMVDSIRVQQSCQRISQFACVAAERARCAAQSARSLQHHM